MTTDLTANISPPNPPKKKKRKTCHKLITLPPPESAEEKIALQNAIEDRGNNLKRLVASILHTADPRAQARYVDAMTRLADGVHYLDVIGSIKDWNHGTFQNHKRWFPAFYKLWRAALDAGEDARQVYRAYLAHKHATEGVERPVFQQGVEVGRIREFDHRLLEFLLKADNPGKYRDQSANVSIQNNVQSIVVEMHRSRDNSSQPPTIDQKPQ